MRGSRLFGAMVPVVSLLFASPSHSQGGDIYWHIDPSVKTCSMVIDPSLTQAQWHTFARQIGAIGVFKSLASAEALGKGSFSVGVDYSITPINQRDPAWINTFTHPDEDCPLGDQIHVPTLRASYGVSRTMDVSGYWTTAPNANYGLVGGEFRYAVLGESERVPATALTTSVTLLTGVPDFNLGVYSVGALASKRFAMFTPYVGIKEGLSVATETTSKVDLNRESVFLTQGFIGTTYSIWRIGIAAEYNIADVNTFAAVVGFNSRTRPPR